MCQFAELLHLFMSSDFARSPAGGIIVGLILLVVKGQYDRHSERKKLLWALNADARTCWAAMDHMARHFPSRSEADAIVEEVTAGSLTFETIDRLPAGWALFVSTFSHSDVLTKLRPKETLVAISYLDAWSRVIEFEKRISSLYQKLLDLTPHLQSNAHRIQLLEIASQLRGCWSSLRVAGQQLQTARAELENMTAHALSWNPLVLLRPPAPKPDTEPFPTDWDQSDRSVLPPPQR